MQIPLAGASLPGTSRRFSPAPHPARACGREPIRFCRQPPPRPRLRRDTHTLLPASPTPPAPSQGYPYTSAGLPHPTRAFGGRLPIPFCRHPPPRRVGAVPERISGEQPCPGCNRWEAVHWTVGISPRGERARGEGELVPPPLSLTLQPSYFSPASPTPPAPSQGNHTLLPAPPPHPRLRQRLSVHFCRHPHPASAFAGIPIRFYRPPPPHPRLWRSSPAPAGGRWQCL